MVLFLRLVVNWGSLARPQGPPKTAEPEAEEQVAWAANRARLLDALAYS